MRRRNHVAMEASDSKVQNCQLFGTSNQHPFIRWDTPLARARGSVDEPPPDLSSHRILLRPERRRLVDPLATRHFSDAESPQCGTGTE
jgi:hypothetical protein